MHYPAGHMIVQVSCERTLSVCSPADITGRIAMVFMEFEGFTR